MAEKVFAHYQGKWVTNIGAFLDRWQMRNMSAEFSDQDYSRFEAETQDGFEREMEKALLRTQSKLIDEK